MKSLKQNWKLLLAAALLVAALVIVGLVYPRQKQDFETQQNSIKQSISMWETSIDGSRDKIAAAQQTIEQYRVYESVQEELPAAEEELLASRTALYEKFPTELREEDQILYILYLERLFGNQILFSFEQPAEVSRFQDGAALGGVDLTVNYQTTYQGFKDMVAYLATDERITSIRNAVVSYNQTDDILIGNLTLRCYVLQPDAYDPSQYEEPEITPPEETGKPVIFH